MTCSIAFPGPINVLLDTLGAGAHVETVLHWHAGRGPASSQGSRPHGAMDESFVDLGAASLLRQLPSGALQASSLGAHPQSFDDMFDVLARTFDMASGATQVIITRP